MATRENRDIRLVWEYRWRERIVPGLIIASVIGFLCLPVLFAGRVRRPLNTERTLQKTVEVVRLMPVARNIPSKYHYVGLIYLFHVATMGYSETPIYPGEKVVANYKTGGVSVDYLNVILTPFPSSKAVDRSDGLYHLQSLNISGVPYNL